MEVKSYFLISNNLLDTGLDVKSYPDNTRGKTEIKHQDYQRESMNSHTDPTQRKQKKKACHGYFYFYFYFFGMDTNKGKN